MQAIISKLGNRNFFKKLEVNFGITIFYIFISFFSIFFLRKTGFLFKGDDLHFHIDRIENLVGLLKSHTLISFISTYSYNKVGIAMDQFYPNLFIYPFAVLRIIVKNPVSAIYDGLMLINLITCGIAHYSYKRFSDSTLKAFIFTNIYFFSTYRFVDMVTRFDLGELLAISFIPLAFWSFFEVFFRDSGKWPALSISMSLLLYSHILSLLFVAFFFVIIIVFNFKRIKLPFRVFKRTLYAVLLFLLFSFGFLYNFLYTYQSGTIKSPGIHILQNEALQPINLLHNSISNNIAGYTGQTYNIGIIAIVILVLLFKIHPIEHFNRVLINLTLFSLFLCTNLFPWFVIQDTPIAIIQIPWRFLIIANFFIAVLGVQVFLKVSKSKAIIVGLPTVLIVLNFTSVNYFIKQRELLPTLNYALTPTDGSSKNRLIKINNKNYYRLSEINNTSDYIPLTHKKFNHSDSLNFEKVIAHYATLQNGKNIHIGDMHSLPNGMRYKISAQKQKGRISLPFYMYNKKNYIVKRNGHKIDFQIDSHRLLNIKSLKSKSTVQVTYHATQVQLIAIEISIVTFIVFIGMAILKNYFI